MWIEAFGHLTILSPEPACILCQRWPRKNASSQKEIEHFTFGLSVMVFGLTHALYMSTNKIVSFDGIDPNCAVEYSRYSESDTSTFYFPV